MPAKSVAVVGGGIFGCLISLKLAENGFAVTLYEQQSELMKGASDINQYRLHRGYHYPRSSETIAGCIDGAESFTREFGEDVLVNDLGHYYAIASEGSMTSPEQYAAVIRAHHLLCEEVSLPALNPDMVSLTIRAHEAVWDPRKLRKIVLDRVAASGIEVKLGKRVELKDLDHHDHIVFATYTSNNLAYGDDESSYKQYQFELCEKLVIEPPAHLVGLSIVVMDGKFMCIDPFGQDTGMSVVGSVEHAIHSRQFGFFPVTPPEYQHLLNRGVVPNPSPSKAQLILEDAERYMPGIASSRLVGSMFTYRTVLPGREKDDARPTFLTTVEEGRILTVFSGKICTCVKAAEGVVMICQGWNN